MATLAVIDAIEIKILSSAEGVSTDTNPQSWKHLGAREPGHCKLMLSGQEFMDSHHHLHESIVEGTTT